MDHSQAEGHVASQGGLLEFSLVMVQPSATAIAGERAGIRIAERDQERSQAVGEEGAVDAAGQSQVCACRSGSPSVIEYPSPAMLTVLIGFFNQARLNISDMVQKAITSIAGGGVGENYSEREEFGSEGKKNEESQAGAGHAAGQRQVGAGGGVEDNINEGEGIGSVGREDEGSLADTGGGTGHAAGQGQVGSCRSGSRSGIRHPSPVMFTDLKEFFNQAKLAISDMVRKAVTAIAGGRVEGIWGVGSEQGGSQAGGEGEAAQTAGQSQVGAGRHGSLGTILTLDPVMESPAISYCTADNAGRGELPTCGDVENNPGLNSERYACSLVRFNITEEIIRKAITVMRRTERESIYYVGEEATEPVESPVGTVSHTAGQSQVSVSRSESTSGIEYPAVAGGEVEERERIVKCWE